MENLIANWPLYLLVWAAVSATLLLCTFTLYIAIMYMKKLEVKLLYGAGIVRWVCYLLIAIGLVFNTALNWWFLTIAYYELPFGAYVQNRQIKFRIETLSTGRIVRHKYESDGFRQIQSLWWCEHWLTPFDIEHCLK